MKHALRLLSLCAALAVLCALCGSTLRGDEPEAPPPFEAYACSLGEVVGHDGDVYRIATPDGRVIGIRANGEPSAANVEADIASPAPDPVPVPPSVTPYQFWRALKIEAGISRTQVLTAVAAIQDADLRDTYLTAIETPQYYERADPTIPGLAQLMGLTSDQVDQVFRTAATL